MPKPLAFLLTSKRRFNGLKFTGFPIQCLHNVIVMKELPTQLLTDAFASALVVPGAALVPLAVVGLHSLSVGGSVGDSERTAENRAAWREQQQNRERESAVSPPTCGGGIGWRCAGPSTALLSRGRTDVSRTL